MSAPRLVESQGESPGPFPTINLRGTALLWWHWWGQGDLGKSNSLGFLGSHRAFLAIPQADHCSRNQGLPVLSYRVSINLFRSNNSENCDTLLLFRANASGVVSCGGQSKAKSGSVSGKIVVKRVGDCSIRSAQCFEQFPVLSGRRSITNASTRPFRGVLEERLSKIPGLLRSSGPWRMRM